MKKKIIGLLFLAFPLLVCSQQKQHDSLAILLIDRMTDVIGDLESCSFALQSSNDVIDSGNLFMKQFTDFHVYMSGPDKMLVNVSGDKGRRQIWYNGEQLAYYFREEHNYGILQVPGTIMEMIDSVNRKYGIQFPAADFFYPSFTDDLLRDADELKYLGRSQVNGKECFHILAATKEMVAQFWISSDAYNLPARFVITYKNKPGNPQYQASFSDWQLNPNLPVAMFDFQAPPGSAKLRILSKDDR
jgi:hypothetical protein